LTALSEAPAGLQAVIGLLLGVSIVGMISAGLSRDYVEIIVPVDRKVGLLEYVLGRTATDHSRVFARICRRLFKIGQCALLVLGGASAALKTGSAMVSDVVAGRGSGTPAGVIVSRDDRRTG